MEYEIHPAAEIFPPMGEEEFNGLVADIKAHGLCEAIVLYDGKVLDGRHRLRACRQLDIEPRFEVWPNSESPEAYVVSKNLHRRHLNTSQRAMVAARMAELPPHRIKSADRPGFKTQGEVADQLNVGERTVRKAKTVLREATPEQIAAVDSGEIALDAVYEKKKPTTYQGPRIRFPDGMTAEETCRKMMLEELNGSSTEDVAKQFGIVAQTYRMMRDVVALLDERLPEKEATFVEKVLTDLNEHGRIAKNYKDIKPIVKRVWGDRVRDISHRDESRRKRLDDFDHAVFMLVQMCATLCDLDIPHLDEDHIGRTVRDIKAAERNIRRFRNKVEGLDK